MKFSVQDSELPYENIMVSVETLRDESKQGKKTKEALARVGRTSILN